VSHDYLLPLPAHFPIGFIISYVNTAHIGFLTVCFPITNHVSVYPACFIEIPEHSSHVSECGLVVCSSNTLSTKEHGSRPEPLQDREVDDVHEFILSLAQSVSKSHTKLMLVHISRQLTDMCRNG